MRCLCLALIAASPAFAQTGQPPAPAPAAAPEAKAEKIICRREAPIGSIVKSKKTCHTRAEWDRIADAARDGANDIIDKNAGRPGSN